MLRCYFHSLCICFCRLIFYSCSFFICTIYLDHDAYDRAELSLIFFPMLLKSVKLRVRAYKSARAPLTNSFFFFFSLMMMMMMLLFKFSFSFDLIRFWGTQYSQFYYWIYCRFSFRFCCDCDLSFALSTHKPFIRLLLVRFTILFALISSLYVEGGKNVRLNAFTV